MSPHHQLDTLRRSAYQGLFGGDPDVVFSASDLGSNASDPIRIDVLVYPIEIEGIDGPVQVAVTSGMSDHRMTEGEDPDLPRRRELLQYFRDCTPGHARRLRDMAWLPLFDGFPLDSHHSIGWEWPGVEGTPWKNALFLYPILRSHREFTFELDGEEVSFLWHIPISDSERAYHLEHGVDALLDRMQQVELPWIFDEDDRPSLVE